MTSTENVPFNDTMTLHQRLYHSGFKAPMAPAAVPRSVQKEKAPGSNVGNRSLVHFLRDVPICPIVLLACPHSRPISKFVKLASIAPMAS